MRRHLRNAVKDRVERPKVVSLLHGSAGLHRSGRPLPLDQLLTWAREEGWNDEDILILRGIALAAANTTSDLGELTRTKAADGTLRVRLSVTRPGHLTER